MTTFAERYAAWEQERTHLSEQEASGDYPHPDAWHGSDDTAVDLLREAVTLLQEADPAIVAV